MRKIIFESCKTDYPFVKEFYIKKYYPENKNYIETKNFLAKKRKLLIPKEFEANNSLNDRITKKKNYYNCIEKFFNKKKHIDFNDKDEEINNYLVDTEFLGKNLIGIQLLIPNQINCINKLKQEGLKDEELNNFFNLIEKNKKNLSILNIEEIEYFIPSLYIPEYMTYIILKTDKAWYFQDYEKKQSIELSSKAKFDFNDAYNGKWKCFAISFINKNLSREMTFNDDKKKFIFTTEKIE